MKNNVGKTDQLIRVSLGLLVILGGFLLESWWGVLGLIPLLTGLVGSCPLYTLLRISSNKEDKKEKAIG